MAAAAAAAAASTYLSSSFPSFNLITWPTATPATIQALMRSKYIALKDYRLGLAVLDQADSRDAGRLLL